MKRSDIGTKSIIYTLIVFVFYSQQGLCTKKSNCLLFTNKVGLFIIKPTNTLIKQMTF